MPATKVGIIYSIAQRRRRVVIVPDDDAQLNSIIVRTGEKFITQGMLAYRAVGPDLAVRQDAGGFPRSDRCAVVNDALQRVVRHIHADDNIDTLSGFTLVNSDISKVGDTWRPVLRRFLRRYIRVDRITRLVTSIETADPESPPADDPTTLSRESDTLVIGDLVPADSVVGGL